MKVNRDKTGAIPIGFNELRLMEENPFCSGRNKTITDISSQKKICSVFDEPKNEQNISRTKHIFPDVATSFHLKSILIFYLKLNLSAVGMRLFLKIE